MPKWRGGPVCFTTPLEYPFPLLFPGGKSFLDLSTLPLKCPKGASLFPTVSHLMYFLVRSFPASPLFIDYWLTRLGGPAGPPQTGMGILCNQGLRFRGLIRAEGLLWGEKTPPATVNSGNPKYVTPTGCCSSLSAKWYAFHNKIFPRVNLLAVASHQQRIPRARFVPRCRLLIGPID